jgi:diguanylate cyclase (GGDEF)-like protein
LSAPLDLLTDTLADAPLTPEQRTVWRNLCAELVLARVRIQELETRLKVMEHTPDEKATGAVMLSRPEFNREVARMLAFDERYGGTSTVVYINIDNLESIKNRHGATLVAAAIQCVSDALINQVRRSDILGRLAPDEFGILLARCDNAHGWKKGEQVASVLHDALMNLWGPGLKPVVSYGAYTFREKEDIATGLKQAAQGLTQLIKG